MKVYIISLFKLYHNFCDLCVAVVFFPHIIIHFTYWSTSVEIAVFPLTFWTIFMLDPQGKRQNFPQYEKSNSTTVKITISLLKKTSIQMNYAFFGRSNVISLSFIFLWTTAASFSVRPLLHWNCVVYTCMYNGTVYYSPLKLLLMRIAKGAFNNQYTYTKTWTMNYE